MPKALAPIPARKELRASGYLSIKSLLEVIRKTFAKIPEHRTGRIEFSLVDTLMSAAAVFGLKLPSLLKFDENRQEAHIRPNLGLYTVLPAKHRVIRRCGQYSTPWTLQTSEKGLIDGIGF